MKYKGKIKNIVIEEIQRKIDETKQRIRHINEKGMIASCDNQFLVYLEKLLSFVINIKEEPVSEDLEKVAELYTLDDSIKPWRNLTKEAFKAGANWQKEKEYTCYEEAFEDGAKWKVENLWKPADGDDLPEIDREVIVLCKGGRVAFGHRPIEKFIARPIGYGKTEECEVKTYGKGGWNIPDVKWWLDCSLPNMEEE